MTPEQLDRFVLEFTELVREEANRSGELPPAVIPFRIDASNPRPIKDVQVVPVGAMMAKCKDSMRIAVHVMLQTLKSDGYLFVTEAWMSAMQPGETEADFDLVPPSKRDNRVTILKVQGRLRTGAGVSYICEASNVVGDRFTKPFDKCDAEETGRFANFFDQEAKE